MNGDRDARGQEVSSSDGYTRPGQVGDQHFDPVSGDGVTAPPSSAGDFPADGTQAGAPAGNPANGPAGNSAKGPGAGLPGSVGQTAGVSGMTSSGDGPGVVAGDTQDGSGDAGTDGIPDVPGRKRRRRKRRKSMSWWIELPILLVFALVLALLIKSFVVQAFYIPSSSMENTLEIGDKVLVNKLIYDFRPIHRGDIIVFNGDGSWEPTPAQTSPPLTRLWVMGDHRAVSWDSRGHMSYPGDGTIPENHVVGRAFVIVAPISRWRILPIPATFEQPALNKASAAALAANPVTTGLSDLRGSGGAVLLGALALPGVPVAAGLTAALPLTLIERRIRRRLTRKGRERPR